MEKVTAMSESQLRRQTKRDTKTTQSHDCDAGLSELLKFPIFRGYAATKIRLYNQHPNNQGTGNPLSVLDRKK